MTGGIQKRIQVRVVVFSTYIIVPAACISTIRLTSPAWTLEWFVLFLFAHFILAWLAYTGNWSWVGTPFRWIYPAELLLTSYHAAGWRGLLASGLLNVFATVLSQVRLRLSEPKSGVFSLALPFREGVYYVGQGGGSRLLNHHNRLRQQQFAVDFLRLNHALTRGRGFYPASLVRYEIFGTTLTSPCNGEVTHVEDSWPDFVPPNRDPQHPVGNHILIRIKGSPDSYVLLAHLKQDSATVKPGDSVVTGQPLALVGNSGNSSEPHLHIQIKVGGRADDWRDGSGAPMVMNGRFLVRGDMIRA